MTSEEQSPVLFAFDAVSLATLTATAALLTRVDRKYVTTAALASKVLASLPKATRVLEIHSQRAMAYSTMYFDTPDLLSYRLAAHSRRRRFKIRSRHYVDSNLAFLEVKTRGARRATVKERIEQPLWSTRQLTDEGRRYANDALSGLGYGPSLGATLEPTLETSYRRATLLLPSLARATVDTQLHWADVSGHEHMDPHMVIIESKSASAPSEIDRVLWRNGVRPVSISKYATGLAALRPELSSTKWRRTIKTHFNERAFAQNTKGK